MKHNKLSCPNCQAPTIPRWRMVKAMVPFAWSGWCPACRKDYRINLEIRVLLLLLMFISYISCLVLDRTAILPHPYWILCGIVPATLFYVYWRVKPQPDPDLKLFRRQPPMHCCPSCQVPTISRWRMVKAMMPFAWGGRCSACEQPYRINLTQRDYTLCLIMLIGVFCYFVDEGNLLLWPYWILGVVIVFTMFYIYQCAKPEPDPALGLVRLNPAKLCCPSCQAPTIPRWRMAKAMVPYAWYGRCTACHQGYRIDERLCNLIYGGWWVSLIFLIYYSAGHHLNTPMWVMLIVALLMLVYGYAFSKPQSCPPQTIDQKIMAWIAISFLLLVVVWWVNLYVSVG